MPLKHVIVHVDSTPQALVRARAARRLADAHGAGLEALLVNVAPMAPYGPAAEALRAELETQRAAGLAALREAGDAVARQTGAEISEITTRGDRVRVDAASMLRAADLVVVGAPRQDKAYLDDDVFHAALFMSGRPCIVLPNHSEAQQFGGRVLIAWKDGREAARAVHDGAPILARAAAVGVFAFKDEQDQFFAGQDAFDRIVGALRARGAPVETAEVRDYANSAYPALAQAIGEFGADLVVMGGYGRSRMTEFLFGGLTRDMLANMPCAALMSH